MLLTLFSCCNLFWSLLEDFGFTQWRSLSDGGREASGGIQDFGRSIHLCARVFGSGCLFKQRIRVFFMTQWVMEPASPPILTSEFSPPAGIKLSTTAARGCSVNDM